MKNEKIKNPQRKAFGFLRGKQNLLILIILGSLLLPLVSLAGEYTSNGQTITYEGLVPCGGEGQSPCQLCHFFVMFAAIINFVVGKLVPVLATLFFVIGGIMFFFAGGSPESLQKAKRLITSVVIGLIIIYGAWIFVNFVLTFSGFINPNLDWNPENWFQIECSVQ